MAELFGDQTGAPGAAVQTMHSRRRSRWTAVAVRKAALNALSFFANATERGLPHTLPRDATPRRKAPNTSDRSPIAFVAAEVLCALLGHDDRTVRGPFVAYGVGGVELPTWRQVECKRCRRRDVQWESDRA